MHDVKSKYGTEWFYSNKVKDHFFKPRNILKDGEEVEKYDKEADGIGEWGSAACGDVMRMWIKVKKGKISDCKWRCFGCASAIAATSMFSVIVTEKGGMEIEKALKLNPQEIVNRLDGLPTRKFHCSVLADQAFKAAVEDYKERR